MGEGKRGRKIEERGDGEGRNGIARELTEGRGGGVEESAPW